MTANTANRLLDLLVAQAARKANLSMPSTSQPTVRIIR
jgi:hypothetical protein